MQFFIGRRLRKHNGKPFLEDFYIITKINNKNELYAFDLSFVMVQISWKKNFPHQIRGLIISIQFD